MNRRGSSSAQHHESAARRQSPALADRLAARRATRRDAALAGEKTATPPHFCRVLQEFRVWLSGQGKAPRVLLFCQPGCSSPGRVAVGPRPGFFTSTEARWRRTPNPRTAARDRPRYDAQDITVLEGLEAVRKRPGMYIGSTGLRGLHHLVYEVVDNSVDEALAGYCDARLASRSTPTTRVTVVDDGRGIPVDDDGEGEHVRPSRSCSPSCTPAASSATAAATRSPAACTASASRSSTRSPSGCIVEIRRDGHVWTQDYERGVPQARPRQGRGDGATTGTTITLPARRRDLRDARLRLLDARAAPARDRLPHARPEDRARSTSARAATASTFQYEGGIEDFVALPQREQGPDPARRSSSSRASPSEGAVEVAMQWNSSYQESVFSLRQQHQHARGRLAPLGLPLGADAHAQHATRASKGLLKEKDENLSGEDVREGLTAVISVKLRRPAVRGPDEDQARQPGRSRASSSRSSTRRLGEFLEENPAEAKPIIRKAVQARAGARGGAQGARPHAPQVGARELDACRASSPTARSRTRRWRRSSSSRATPPAARPSRAATATRRRCCRCAARSSTSRRRASTRSSQNDEIQALITAIGTGVARRVRPRERRATTRSS